MRIVFDRAYSTRLAMSLLTVTAIAFPSAKAFAHGSAGDLAVFNNNGQVDVGFAHLDDDDINQIYFDPNDSVFQSVLAPVAPFIPLDLGGPEPGWDINENEFTPFATLTPMAISIEYWNGIGPVSFAPATGVAVGFYETSYVLNSQGGGHKHFIHGLDDLTADAQPIPDGVYRAKLKAAVTGFVDSNPFYQVMLVDQLVVNAADPEGAAEELGVATAAYLADPLANPAPSFGGKDFTFFANGIRDTEALFPVPEPATTLLAATALLGLLAIRRR